MQRKDWITTVKGFPPLSSDCERMSLFYREGVKNSTTTFSTAVLLLLSRQSGVLLGSALCGNHTLEWLDLSYNALGEEGAQAIGTALAVRGGILPGVFSTPTSPAAPAPRQIPVITL